MDEQQNIESIIKKRMDNELEKRTYIEEGSEIEIKVFGGPYKRHWFSRKEEIYMFIVSFPPNPDKKAGTAPGLHARSKDEANELYNTLKEYFEDKNFRVKYDGPSLK